MKYNNEVRKEKSQINKDKILDCAIALINEKGFDNVSVEEITKKAGVSKGAFYIHYKSKEEIIEKEINNSYGKFILNEESKTPFEKLEYFLIESVKEIKRNGVKMAQCWFSESILGSYYGQQKLEFDLSYVVSLYNEDYAKEVISIFYGALNLWCFTNNEIDPELIIKKYLEKERSKQ